MASIKHCSFSSILDFSHASFSTRTTTKRTIFSILSIIHHLDLNRLEKCEKSSKVRKYGKVTKKWPSEMKPMTRNPSSVKSVGRVYYHVFHTGIIFASMFFLTLYLIPLVCAPPQRTICVPAGKGMTQTCLDFLRQSHCY